MGRSGSMATDLDLQVDESVPAESPRPVQRPFPRTTLFDIVRKLPEGSQVELTPAEGKNAGRCGSLPVQSLLTPSGAMIFR